MYWNRAVDHRQLWTHDWMFDECESAISQDERVSGDPQVLMIFSPRAVEVRSADWKHPISLLVTNTHIVAARKKTLQKHAEIMKWFRYDFNQYGVGLWRGYGPGFSVHAMHETQGRVAFVFTHAQEAEPLGNWFRDG